MGYTHAAVEAICPNNPGACPCWAGTPVCWAVAGGLAAVVAARFGCCGGVTLGLFGATVGRVGALRAGAAAPRR